MLKTKRERGNRSGPSHFMPHADSGIFVLKQTGTCILRYTACTYLSPPNSDTDTHLHTLRQFCLINSFLCRGGVMTADSSQSPEDQRVTPLIN